MFPYTDTMGATNWPHYSTAMHGCPVDHNWFYSGNLFRPICKPISMEVDGNTQLMRQLEDQYVRNRHGLENWNALTSSVIVSGGGDPNFHGVYAYAGHYWGVPFYRKGDHYIAYNGMWQLVDARQNYPIYTGSGALAYPWEVTSWTASFGSVNNVPTFTKASDGHTISVPLWPAYEPTPPGPRPWEPGFYQQDFVYNPDIHSSAGQVPTQWTPPPAYNPPPVYVPPVPEPPIYGGGGGSGGGYQAPAPELAPIYVEELVETKGEDGSTSTGETKGQGSGGNAHAQPPIQYLGPPVQQPPQPGGVGATVNPLPPVIAVTTPGGQVVTTHAPTTNVTPAGLQQIQDQIAAAFGSEDGTIFGFSPLLVVGAGIAAFMIMND